ncbi:oligosaccharide flippase family protein [Oscillochloris sp. ZM17-4]|uniref:lipopolysaccharide biosynthesis protein n=1 Tax=Oscillochloris sp. ZM17-4 TaxID=2866714 RepID=UPI001C73BB7D|nr:oligosaccharide flippase family protein [Oscillochloris sp. ZM17-4]MBX0331022.1 oligosaccharide flippase family protein [Oscillochloris sp. ZM17-4]
MGTTLGKLAKLSAVYAFGDIITKAAAILLLPVYMRYLRPADYGIIGVAEMIKQILIVLLSFGLMGAIARFYYQAASDEERRRSFGSLWLFIVVVSGGITLLLDQFGAAIFGALLRQIPFDPYIRMTIWTAFFQAAFVTIPPNLFRAREQAISYVGFNVLAFSLTTCCIIGLVIWRQQGAEGYMRAQLLASAVMAALSTLWLLRSTSPNLRLTYLRPLLIYSLPLVPHFVAHWALNFSDRAILERYVSLDQLGIYTLAYQFGFVMQLMVGAGNNALMPMFNRAAKDAADMANLPRVITYYVLAIALVVLGVSASADSMVRLLMPPVYHDAGMIAIWIVVSYMVVGLYYMPMNVLAQTAGRTLFIPLLTLTAAACNIILNLIFVPRWGIMAAVVDTLIGFLVLLLLIFLAAQRRCPIGYEYGRIGKVLLALGASLAIASMVLRWSPILNLVFVPGVLLLLPLALWALGFWTAQELRYLGSLRHTLAARWPGARRS